MKAEGGRHVRVEGKVCIGKAATAERLVCEAKSIDGGRGGKLYAKRVAGVDRAAEADVTGGGA
jgi:hypothetical protein